MHSLRSKEAFKYL